MANIFDYIYSQGNYTFSEKPFTHIDGLVLSRFSYIPFDRILSADFDRKITVRQAAERFLNYPKADSSVFLPDDINFIRGVEKSPRFSQMKLFGYVNRVNVDERKQFAVLTAEISKGLYFVSFRGTDNTFVGFREDFDMCLEEPIPSQTDALKYFEDLAKRVRGNFILGGHSKGGNLAVYAAAFCPKKIQEKVIRIYNIDGPGFPSKLAQDPDYLRICPKIYTFVPQSSVIGMLLERSESEIVIHSTYWGLLQHDIYSWEIDGESFVLQDSTTKFSKIVGSTIKSWTLKMDQEEKRQFINFVFDLIASTNAGTVDAFAQGLPKNLWTAFRSFTHTDKNIRHVVYKDILALISSAVKSTGSALAPKRRNKNEENEKIY